VAALGFLKTVDGIYVTETELATTLADYSTTTDSALAMGQALSSYQTIANLASDVAALGYAPSTDVYTKTAADSVF